MKHTNKFFAGTVLLAGLNLAVMTGCGGGYVEAGGPVYYGDGPWIDNTVVVEGRGGWFGGHHDAAYVHPSNHAAPAAHASASSGGGGRSGGDSHVDHH